MTQTQDPRELSELARWEGEGGAVSLRIAHYKASPGRLSLRVGMSAFSGHRGGGAPQRPSSRQNPQARPMNTHRGVRSR